MVNALLQCIMQGKEDDLPVPGWLTEESCECSSWSRSLVVALISDACTRLGTVPAAFLPCQRYLDDKGIPISTFFAESALRSRILLIEAKSMLLK